MKNRMCKVNLLAE